MDTSRFQIGFIAALAMGLGFSLASSEAIGYPAGAAVSLGENPLWSHGKRSTAPVETVFTAPTGRDMILTDLSLTTRYDWSADVELKLADGTILGSWIINGAHSSHSAVPVSMSMTSGIRVPQGQSLFLHNPAGRDVAFTASGYYAQP